MSFYFLQILTLAYSICRQNKLFVHNYNNKLLKKLVCLIWVVHLCSFSGCPLELSICSLPKWLCMSLRSEWVAWHVRKWPRPIVIAFQFSSWLSSELALSSGCWAISFDVECDIYYKKLCIILSQLYNITLYILHIESACSLAQRTIFWPTLFH